MLNTLLTDGVRMKRTKFSRSSGKSNEMPLQMYVRMRVFLFRLTADRRGVTALEYGLIAAVMGALIVTAVTTLGNNLSTAFTSIGGLLTSKASGM